jgi:predicted MFS family arabinose efflux permease
MPVLFKEISQDLGLSLVAVGTIWGADPLAGIFVGLPSGLLVDRFGPKKTLTMICILGGIFAFCRGLSFDFLSMAAFMFLFGSMCAMSPTIVIKTVAVWTERARLGFLNALIFASWSIFSMVASMTSATILSPLLGGWRNVFFLMALPLVVIGLLWLFTGREPKRGEVPIAPSGQVPLGEALSRVIRIKEVWFIGIISLAFWGANNGFLGYLPTYLRNIGWSPAGADGAFTAFNAASLVGIVPMIFLANRLKAHRAMFFFSMIVMVLNLALLPLTDGGGVWAVIIISAFFRSAALPLTTVVLYETRGVGNSYGGTALGLVTSIGMIGGFAAPPLGNSLESLGPGAPFFFWAALVAVSLPLFLFIKKRAEVPAEIEKTGQPVKSSQ